MDIQPVTLEGRYTRLQPLTLDLLDGLWEAGTEADLWNYTTSKVHTRDQMRTYIEAALAEQARKASIPFATVDVQSGRVAGCTRFMNIEVAHKRVEIGSTWVTPAFQRTPVNTEAKYLMFRHAFEVWGMNRVELKTCSRNQKSRAAIARVGAKEEGILRRHIINADGYVRDSVYFGLIAEEWPAVKAMLEEKLARPW